MIFFVMAQEPDFPNPTAAQSGIYTVRGIVSGCATAPVNASVLIHPTPQPYLGEDTLICLRQQPSDLLLDPGAFQTYRWQDNSRLSTFRVEAGGMFRVEVIDAFGCSGSDEVILLERCPSQVYAPNAFSPNDDGTNDRFQVFTSDITSMQLRIFDRWGNQVFETTDPDAAWNGFWLNRPAPVGVYVWMLLYEGFQEDGTMVSGVESGEVSLLR